MAGPRHRHREHMSRHPEVRAKRTAKGDARGGRASLEARPQRVEEARERAYGRALQEDGERRVSASDLPAARNGPLEEAKPTSVQNVAVTGDEAGMRVDRFLEARFPGLSF